MELEAFAGVLSDASLPSAGAAGRLHLCKRIPAESEAIADVSALLWVCCYFIFLFYTSKGGKFGRFHLDSLDQTISPPSVENHRTKQKLLLTADDQNAPAVCKLGHIWVLFLLFLFFIFFLNHYDGRSLLWC